MHCASCSKLNELSLSKLPGVNKATVDLNLQAATVEFDDQQTSLEQLHQAVIKNGYQISK